MLFSILQGPSSRIDTETTPLHEGYAYFTPDTSGFYIDAKVDGVLQRIQINPNEVVQAVRDETTYSEITDAYNRGCTVICVDGTAVCQLYSLNEAKKTALFLSIYKVDENDVAHIRAWEVTEGDDGATTWTRHSKVTTEAIVDSVTEQNAAAEQKFWRGTKEEFDAIETKDDSVMYIVTDDDSGSDSEVFVVHFTWDDNYENVQADHTLSEIRSAVQAGKYVIGTETYNEDTNFYHLIDINESLARFQCIWPYSNYMTYGVLCVTDDGAYADYEYGASYYHGHYISDIYDLEDTLAEVTTAVAAAEATAEAAAAAATNEISIYKAAIGTTWEDDEATGVKTQTVPVYGVSKTDTAMIDCVYDGDYTAESYAEFAEQKDQYLTNITDGFSETVDDGIKFTIFGDANTVNIPILVEAIHHRLIDTSCLTFSAPETFSISVASPGWDGIMEYSTDAKSWSVWDGSEISGTVVYIRGSGNTKVSMYTMYPTHQWTLAGSDIACTGNIETLLDYQTVLNGEHPTMARYCYYFMFWNRTGLITAPALPATTLAEGCYAYMFSGCTGLTTAPELPATTLAEDCYCSMFSGCTGLTTAPELPATTLASGCYKSMFSGCTGLTTAPELPATVLAQSCYSYMFYNCTGLTTAPKLPVTTLVGWCYFYMFSDCTNLTTAPELPATTLAEDCYAYMFDGCTNLTTAPELPATTLASGCYKSMFSGCTGLTTTPELPATTLAKDCYKSMFWGCTGLTTAPELPATVLAQSCYSYMFYYCPNLTTAPELPATTLAEGCYAYMFRYCTSLKLSTTQTDEYTQEYRIPTTGEGTIATDALSDMFSSTGGTFTDTPEINTTYYLHESCSIV